MEVNLFFLCQFSRKRINIIFLSCWKCKYSNLLFQQTDYLEKKNDKNLFLKELACTSFVFCIFLKKKKSIKLATEVRRFIFVNYLFLSSVTNPIFPTLKIFIMPNENCISRWMCWIIIIATGMSNSHMN